MKFSFVILAMVTSGVYAAPLVERDNAPPRIPPQFKAIEPIQIIPTNTPGSRTGKDAIGTYLRREEMNQGPPVFEPLKSIPIKPTNTPGSQQTKEGRIGTIFRRGGELADDVDEDKALKL